MFDLICPIASAAAQTPERSALVAQKKRWNYRQLDQKVRLAASHLQRKKVEEHSCVAFLGNNYWQTIVLLFALQRLKVPSCLLNTRLPPDGIQQALKALGDPLYLEPDSLHWENEKPLADHELATDQIATYLFTSGSSGPPKIASHSIGNYLLSALGSNQALDLRPQDRWLLSLPLFHVGGLAILWRSFLAGATVLLPSSGHEDVSHLSLVPTQLYRKLDDPSLKRCRAILLGGAPIPAPLYEEACRRGLKIFTTYGLTEMTAQVTLDGLLLPYRDLQLAEDGEILVKGETLFHGYKEEAIDRKSWFPSGDLGRWNNGKLEIIGRRDNLFISGGENIQPEEIETLLFELPGVVQAIVVPVADPLFGQRPVAFVEGGESLSLQQTLDRLLPRYKIPLNIYPLPQQKALKPQRKELAELAAVLIKNGK